MNLLLDTHALLWFASDSRRLGRQAGKLIRSPANLVWVSAVSLWEISLKASLDRATISERLAEVALEDLERYGFKPLPITIRHALAIRDLPWLHRDPFDRMLVAQALCEDLTLLTADPLIRTYDIRTLDATA